MRMQNGCNTFWTLTNLIAWSGWRLAYPDLLTHEEQLVWKLVRENGVRNLDAFFRFTGDGLGHQGRVRYSDRLREHYPVFKAVANGSQGVYGPP